MTESELDKLVNGLMEQIQAYLATAKNEQRLLKASELNVLSICIERLNNMLLSKAVAKGQQSFFKEFTNFDLVNEPPDK